MTGEDAMSIRLLVCCATALALTGCLVVPERPAAMGSDDVVVDGVVDATSLDDLSLDSNADDSTKDASAQDPGSGALDLFEELSDVAKDLLDGGEVANSQCGDGKIEAPEECEPGNGGVRDGCVDCRIAEFEVARWDGTGLAGALGLHGATAGDDGFVLVWSGQSDQGGSGVFSKTMSIGPKGWFEDTETPLQINEDKTGTQSWARIARLKDGTHAVVWSSIGGGNPRILMRRVSEGALVDTEREVARCPDCNHPAITPLSGTLGDNLMVVWDDNHKIHVRSYHDGQDDAGIVAEDLVGTVTYRKLPSVALGEDGVRMVIVWQQSLDVSYDAARLWFRDYAVSADGSLSTGAVMAPIPMGLDVPLGIQELNPMVWPTGDGFRAVWERRSSSGVAIVSAILGAGDDTWSDASTIAGGEGVHNLLPTMTTGAAAGHVTAWMRHCAAGAGCPQDANIHAVFGHEIDVNTLLNREGGQSNPVLLSLASEEYLVAWTSVDEPDAPLFHIYAQRFDADGHRIYR